MDERLRRLGREAARQGAVQIETAYLRERARAGDISRQQLMVGVAAGIPSVCMAAGMPAFAAEAIDECDRFLPALPEAEGAEVRSGIIDQIACLWNLNREMRWGVSAIDFITTPMPTTWPGDGFHCLVLVPYFDTLSKTIKALSDGLKRLRPTEYQPTFLDRTIGQIHLRDGCENPAPGLRWESINFGAVGVVEFPQADLLPHAGVFAALVTNPGLFQWFLNDNAVTLCVPGVYVENPDWRYCFANRAIITSLTVVVRDPFEMRGHIIPVFGE